MPNEAPALMNTKEAASYLGVSESYLEKNRIKKRNIPFIKLSARVVRYKKEDLDSYIEENRHA